MRKSHTMRLLAPALVVLVAVTWFLATPASAQQDTSGEPLLITLEADSTPVVTVLDILADRSGLNIVTSPEVQGTSISIRLSNTPFDEALNLVVRAAGMGYERVGNSILVGSPQRLATQTGLSSRVFDLQYAEATEIAEALDVISKDLRSVVSGNQLVVRAPAAHLEEVERLIAQLDKKPEQVMFEARLLEINTDELQELGIDWSQITKYSTVITEGLPAPSESGELPEDLDYTRFDVSPDIYRQVLNFQVTLDLLITEGHGKILANSKITTMENKPAEIFIGTRTPVIISTLQSGSTGGTFQSVQLEYIDTGVKLNITPRIADDGSITVVTAPNVSNIVAFRGADELPVTSERTADTTVRVKDGQTFYLGGLLLEAERETIMKVPLLGDIPLLGYLFRHYNTEYQHTDLVIEITPTILSE